MKKEKFHHGWSVGTADGGAFAALMGGGAPEKPVVLPHDHLVEIPRNPEEPNGAGNGFFHEEDLVYKKTFSLRPDQAGKRIWLEFEGVYQNAFVYVNGAFAGKCAYGYSNFYLDITKFLKPEEENSIKVVVKNGVPSGRWYTGGGIYRDVSIMAADPTHIAPDGVFLWTKELEPELAAVGVKVELSNETASLEQVVIRAALLEEDGTEAARGEMPVTLGEFEKNEYRLSLYVRNPRLWDDLDPRLYRYRVELLRGDALLDEETGTFGIRKLSLDPVHGLRVNGRTVKLRGGCIHHDNGVIGTREFPFAARERIRTLKAAGFNAVRSSHYPMSRQLLEACDLYGMYVMDEYSDVWTSSKVAYDYSMHMTEWWEHDIANLVRKDRNHPCVIMYSIGNEIPEVGNPIDAAWGKRLADRLKALDPTRYTTNSMNLMLAGMSLLSKMAGGQTGEINTTMSSMGDMMNQLMASPVFAKLTEEAAGQVDIVGYNYALARYEPEGSEYPNRILVGSETNPPDLDMNWAAVEKLPYVIGDFDWTAWDYLGENGIGATGYGEGADIMGMMYAPYPFKAAYCGDIDLIGNRRATSYWREIIWGLRAKPWIAVQSPAHYGEKKQQSTWVFTDALRSWTFAGFEGKGAVVEVYADADEVELLINGKSAGRKKTGENKRALTVFDTVYEPGEITAVAYRNGVETGRDTLTTAGSPAALKVAVKSEGGTLPADGSDIAYFDVSVVDAAGVLNPDKALAVTVSAEGPGAVIGFGSASPCSEENYYDATVTTYEGHVRAAVRGTGRGTVTLTFRTPEGISASAGIEAV